MRSVPWASLTRMVDRIVLELTHIDFVGDLLGNKGGPIALGHSPKDFINHGLIPNVSLWNLDGVRAVCGFAAFVMDCSQ